MIVDVRIQERGIEPIERRGIGGIDMRPAHVFAHDGGVFGFHQAVVAGAAGTALGLLDGEFLRRRATFRFTNSEPLSE